jgi:hypothetical protein
MTQRHPDKIYKSYTHIIIMNSPDMNPDVELILDSHRHASAWLINFLNNAGLAKGFIKSTLESHFISDEAMADKALWIFVANTHEESGACGIFTNTRTVKTFYLDPALKYSNDHQQYDADKAGFRGGILVFESEWKMHNKHMFEGFKGKDALPDVFKDNLENAVKELPSLDEKYQVYNGLSEAAYQPQYELKYTKEYKSTPFKYLKRGFSLSMPFTEQAYDVQTKILKNLNARLDVFNDTVRNSEVFLELEEKYKSKR